VPRVPVLATSPADEGYALLRIRLDWPLGPGQGLVLSDGRVLRPFRRGRDVMDFLLAPDDALTQARSLTIDAVPSTGVLPPASAQTVLLLSSGAGIGPALYAGRCLPEGVRALSLHDCSAGLPQRPQPSRLLTRSLPPEVIAALPWFEEAAVTNRLADPAAERPGCYAGPVWKLAERWLASNGSAVLWVWGYAGLIRHARWLARRYALNALAFAGTRRDPIRLSA